MTLDHINLRTDERILRTEETQIVPDGGAPVAGALTLTNCRLVVSWEAAGRGRRQEPRTAELELTEIADCVTPGGPLVQVIARGGQRISIQTFAPIQLRQAILEAASHASGKHAAGEPHAGGDYATRCGRCASPLPAEAWFCPYCAAYARADCCYCRTCRQELPTLYVFCPQCGGELTRPGGGTSKQPRH